MIHLCHPSESSGEFIVAWCDAAGNINDPDFQHEIDLDFVDCPECIRAAIDHHDAELIPLVARRDHLETR